MHVPALTRSNSEARTTPVHLNTANGILASSLPRRMVLIVSFAEASKSASVFLP
jgi:hypothetical protein